MYLKEKASGYYNIQLFLSAHATQQVHVTVDVFQIEIASKPSIAGILVAHWSSWAT